MIGRPQRQTAAARFLQPPDVVFDAITFAVRRVGGEILAFERANLHLRFGAPDGRRAVEHHVYVFPDPTGGCELDMKVTSPDSPTDGTLYSRIATELAGFLDAHNNHKKSSAPAAALTDLNPMTAERPRSYKKRRRVDRQRGPFRCPFCGSDARPHVTKNVSTGGWIVFTLFILFFFPLFWIGLLIKDTHRECFDCGMRIGQ